MDVYVQSAEELLAWEVYVAFDPDVLEIIGRDTKLLLASNPGSSVLDVSARLPNREGLYRAAAADTSDPPTPDSGSGVLLRLSLMAVGAGTSDIELVVRDIDGDGLADLGPLLRNVDGDVVGDTNGDTVFDGPIASARAEVGAACDGTGSGPGPRPSDSAEGGGGVSTVVIAVAAVGGGLALLAAGLLAFRRVRRPRAA